VTVAEVADEPLANIKSKKDEQNAKNKEAERILAKCPPGFLIACDVKGQKYDSEGFADRLSEIMTNGAGTLVFVVGGSIGLADDILKKADMRISLSDMTMPHRLFRVVLLEQIYRAFKIMNGETYHK
jgi:23S rRNA (pseudouridine1915-N3)-methyltransferase